MILIGVSMEIKKSLFTIFIGILFTFGLPESKELWDFGVVIKESITPNNPSNKSQINQAEKTYSYHRQNAVRTDPFVPPIRGKHNQLLKPQYSASPARSVKIVSENNKKQIIS